MKFNLSNVPEDYVSLKGELLKKMILSVSNHNSLREFSKRSKVKIHKLLKFTCNKNQRKNILISELRRILEFLKEEGSDWYKIVENNINSIGRFQTIIKPKFSIDFSTTYAASFLGDILTDGAFCMKGDVIYSNTNIREIKNNIKIVNFLFCKKKIKSDNLERIIEESYVNCKVYKRKDGYMIVKYPISIGKYLKAIGMIPGKRVYTDPPIPKTILKSSVKTKIKFLERIIINEGYVNPKVITIMHSKDYYVDHKPPKLLIGYKKLFNDLNIKTSRIYLNHCYYTKSGHKRFAWAIHITGQSINKMLGKFTLNDKQSYLEMRRNVEIRLPSRNREKQILEILKKKSLKNNEIANVLNISPASVSMYTKKLENKRLIIRKKHKTAFINIINP